MIVKNEMMVEATPGLLFLLPISTPSPNTIYHVSYGAFRRVGHLYATGLPLIAPKAPAHCDQLPMTPRHDYWHYSNPATPQMEAYLNMHNHVIGYLMFGFFATSFMLVRHLRLHCR